jgi:polysaccharide biosynthesis protein PslG
VRVVRAARRGRPRWRVALATVLAAVALAALAASVEGRPIGAAARSPDYGPQPAPSLFGLNTGTYDHDSARLALDTPMAAAMGAQWVHFTAGSLSFSGKTVSFAGLDNAVDQARAYHLGVLISLGGVPAACSLKPQPDPITSCPPTNASDLHAYSQFLSALLLNLRGRVEYFESWVEPNHASMWAPAPDAAAYARLLISEYRTVRTLDSRYGLDDKLLFAGIGGSDLGYLSEVLDALHGQRAFDLVGDAPYRFPPTPPATANPALSFPGGGHPALTWEQELTDYEGQFTSHGYGETDMWLTEFGWPGVPGPSAAACSDADDSPAEQERSEEGAFSVMKALGFVKAAFWENQRDYERGYTNRDP